MRITEQQIVDATQYSMNSTYDQMSQAQLVLATGKSINTPSDNPIGAAVALELQGRISQNDGFASTIGDSLGWMQQTDASLGSVSDTLTQARTLAVQGANDTLTPDERQAVAANVLQLLQQAVQSANGQYAGRYVLSGQQTNKAPFTLDLSGASPTVTYNGDSQPIQREIMQGQMMQINTPGSTALPGVFNALIGLYNDLKNNNSTAIGGDIQTIDNAHDGLMLAQATVGARVNQLQSAQQSVEGIGVDLHNQESTLVDADMAKAAVDFSTRQAAYQAALTAASKVIQPSLLEFLR